MIRSKTVKLASRLAISGLIGVSGISLGYAGGIGNIIDWENRAFEKSASIAPKKSLEICGAFDKAEAITWQFKGSAATDFNIHYHVGKNVNYPKKSKGTQAASGKFVIPVDQTYCWMWTNKGSEPVTLNVTLKK